jgi:hypothetical protein
MSDDPNDIARRLAERLAGGTTVKGAMLKVPGGRWVSGKSFICPHCRTVNSGVFCEKDDSEMCISCGRVIRILGEEISEIDISEAAEAVYRELYQNGADRVE